MALRNSLIAKIWAAIEKSPFTVADFDVVFGEHGNPLLSVVFRHQEAYRLEVKENYKSEISVHVSPGEHKKEEIYSLQSLSEIPESITSWARNVRDELRATVPVYSEIDEIRSIIDRHVAEHVNNPSEPFTESEASDLREKLDQLSAKFQEMVQKSELTEQELNRLNQEITSIKANLNAYPKGVWYKTAANKLMITVGKIATSQEGRSVLSKAAQRMLGLDSPAP